MKYIKLFVLIGIAVMEIHSFAATQEERLAELERIALYEESDWIDENEVIPTPADAKKKFNLTDAELYNDIMSLACKYSNTETNKEKRMCRSSAIGWLGGYGSTSDLSFLAVIRTNNVDYAQESAVFATLRILKSGVLFIPMVREVVTNTNLYSQGLRRLVYCHLHNMCKKDNGYVYVSDGSVRDSIAAFFLERAALETDEPLYIDEVACKLNPSYRHSQQRRDNLARVRNPKLSGHPAELYDEAQRDALPKEEK